MRLSGAFCLSRSSLWYDNKRKYQSLPIPGSDTTLDFSRLLSEAVAEKEALTTQLREDLEETTTLATLTRGAGESEQQQSVLTFNDPYQIYIH